MAIDLKTPESLAEEAELEDATYGAHDLPPTTDEQASQSEMAIDHPQFATHIREVIDHTAQQVNDDESSQPELPLIFETDSEEVKVNKLKAAAGIPPTPRKSPGRGPTISEKYDAHVQGKSVAEIRYGDVGTNSAGYSSASTFRKPGNK